MLVTCVEVDVWSVAWSVCPLGKSLCNLHRVFSPGYFELDNYSCHILSFFFFSSRRRHTRLQGDWSSDVCSSDLATTTCRSLCTESASYPCPELNTAPS